MGNSTLSKARALAKAASKFEHEEIRVLERTFHDLANRSPGRTIDKITFLKVFKLPGMFGERLFAAFDRKKNGVIDLEEFLSGLGLIVRGDMAEKINFMFTMFDLQGDGVVSRRELRTMLNSILFAACTIVQTSSPDALHDERLGTNDSRILSDSVEQMVHDAFESHSEAETLTKEQFQNWAKENLHALSVMEAAFGPPLSTSESGSTDSSPERVNKVTLEDIMNSPRPLQNYPHSKNSNFMKVNSSTLEKPSATTTITCRKCQYKMKFSFCNTCGRALIKNFECAECGPILSDKNLVFCLSCGFDLRHNDKPVEPSYGISSSGAVQLTKMEGWLYKVGALLGKLKSRWFVLKDNFLYSFHDAKSVRPSMVIYLEGCFVDTIDHVKQSPKRAYGIEILMSQKQNHKRCIYAKTKDLRNRWLEAIRKGARQFILEDYYEVKEELGIGKFSSVHSCTHKANGLKFAVKIIDKSSVDDEEREALRTEIAVLQLVRHPNIIRLKNVFETKELIYIVTDLVEGGDLFDRVVKRKKFSEIATKKIATQILQAIDYLHERGIVHRDLKPENILLSSKEHDEHVKIGDFGLSKFAAPEEIMNLPCGTLAYVAPEVLQMKGYSKKVDLWSIGVIVYVLICGKLPFASKVRSVLIQKTMAGELPIENNHIWANISSQCIDFVRNLLHPNPNLRFTVRQALGHEWITGVSNEQCLTPKLEAINTFHHTSCDDIVHTQS